MKRIKEPRVTLKTAKALAEMVLGTAKGLAKDKECPFDLFTMQMGTISVRIQPAHYSGRVSVEVGTGCNGRIYMLFDPVTLEQDYEEEDIQRRTDRREAFDEWVGANGPDVCKKSIDDSWNKNRG